MNQVHGTTMTVNESEEMKNNPPERGGLMNRYGGTVRKQNESYSEKDRDLA